MPHVTEHPNGSIAYADLMTGDLADAKAFYSELFGWEVMPAPNGGAGGGGGDYALALKKGLVVAGLGSLRQELQDAGTPPFWNLYVGVDDIQAIAERIESLGGELRLAPTAIPIAGTMAVAADPEGAGFSLWQASAQKGSALMNEPGTLCWSEVYSKTPRTTQAFYAALFGWRFQQAPGVELPYWEIALGERPAFGGMLQMDERWGGMASHWMPYFAVEDLGASLAQLQKLGGAAHTEAMQVAAGRFAVAADRQGAHFTLMQLERAD